MAGYFTWVRENVVWAVSAVFNAPFQLAQAVSNSVSQGVAVTQSTVKQIGDLVGTVTNNETVRDQAYENFAQGLEGFTRPVDPTVAPALMRSKNTRRAMGHSVSANLILYMGSVILYQLGMRELRRMVPDYEDSYAEMATDALATMYFIRTFISMYVDNTVTNMNLYQAVNKDYPPNKRNFRPCQPEECGTTATIQAGLMSSFYYLGNLGTVSFISSNIPVIGKFVAAPFRALAYGQALTEYKLGSVGMCTEHRYKELTKNNAYSVGLGLSMLAAVSSSAFAIKYYTGAESFFIEDALFNFFFQYYMFSSLVSNKPLPGKKPGLDVFSHSRVVVDKAMEQTADWIIPQLQNPGDDDLLEQIRKAADFRPVKLARTVFIKTDLQDWGKFTERESMVLFIDLHGKDMQDGVQGILDIRNDNKTRLAKNAVKKIPTWIPKKLLNDEKRLLLQILYNKDVKFYLLQLDKELSRLRTRSTIKAHEKLNRGAFVDRYRQLAIEQKSDGPGYGIFDSDTEDEAEEKQKVTAVVTVDAGKPKSKSSRSLVFGAPSRSKIPLRQQGSPNIFSSPETSPVAGRREQPYSLRKRH